MIEKPEILEMHAVMRGEVQGVFFRATAKEIAQELNLKGTVKNLPDGTVEIYAQGPSRRLYILIERLQGRFELDPESSASITMSEPKELFEGFQIVF